MAQAEPALTALMCDGMGWFSATDYKRALLLYDRIHYLLPRDTVPFRDLDGRSRQLVFPPGLRDSPLCRVTHFELDGRLLRLVTDAAAGDAADAEFLQAVSLIPEADQAYAWRLVNASPEFGGGTSPGLAPDQFPRAQALLLNTFLLAADALGHAPITGKAYLHRLVAAKYPRAAALSPRHGPPLRRDLARSVHPVARELSSALISDEQLAARTEEEILEYKAAHRPLFLQFSSELLQLAAALRAMPDTRDFEAEVTHCLQTTIWQRRRQIEGEFQASWQAFFRTSAKAAVTGLLGVGVAPLLPLGALVAGAAAAVGAWAVPDLLDTLFKFRKARSHGLYYLMGF